MGELRRDVSEEPLHARGAEARAAHLSARRGDSIGCRRRDTAVAIPPRPIHIGRAVGSGEMAGATAVRPRTRRAPGFSGGHARIHESRAGAGLTELESGPMSIAWRSSYNEMLVGEVPGVGHGRCGARRPLPGCFPLSSHATGHGRLDDGRRAVRGLRRAHDPAHRHAHGG